jgi:hypothetical protein
MTKSLHLICRQQGAGLIGVSHDRHTGLSTSVSWELSAGDAEKIIGGWVYLHESKGSPSRHGGYIRDVKESGQLTHNGRAEYAIFFEPRTEAKGQKWRGADFGMAWYSGLVEPGWSHELSGHDQKS